MQKKKNVIVELKLNDEQEYAYIHGRDVETDTKYLTEFLNRGIRNKSISFGTKLRDNEYTKYKFEVKIKENDEPTKYNFIVKVKNSQKSYHFQTVKYIENLCDTSVTMKKQNRMRLISLLAAGTIAVVAATPFLAKGLNKLFEKDYRYQQQIYNNQSYSENYIPTVEDRENSEKEYYRELEEKAKSGDKEAIQEYSRYIMEQQLEEEALEQRKTK